MIPTYNLSPSNSPDKRIFNAVARFINQEHPFFIAAFVNVIENRFSVSDTINVEDSNYKIILDDMIVSIPKKTTISLIKKQLNFPYFLLKKFPSLMDYGDETINTIDLGGRYPPSGMERIFDPYKIFSSSGKFGAGILDDDENYWKLGLSANLTITNKKMMRDFEKRKRISHFHYEYPTSNPASLIFVDIGTADLPSKDQSLIALLHSCREPIKRLGEKYLLSSSNTFNMKYLHS